MYVLLIREVYVRDVVCNFSTYVELVREPQFLLLIPKQNWRCNFVFCFRFKSANGESLKFFIFVFVFDLFFTL